MKRSTLLVLGLISAMGGCKREVAQQKGDAPPPSATAVAGLCRNGGAKVSDPISAKQLVPQVGGFCLDPNNEVRTYGKDATGTIEQVCTELFDGECEVYRSFGLERVVAARYADGEGSPATVSVNLSRFETQQGAFGFFTKRVVGDADPATLTMESFDAGAQAVLGSGTAYVVRGVHVVEFAYANDNEAPDAMKASAKKILPQLGKAIGELLPGDKKLPRAVRLLPQENRIPLGVTFDIKDSLGIDGIGPGAIGYYREGAKRFRVLVVDRANDEAAQDVMKTIKRATGSLDTKNLPATITLSVANPEGTLKTEWVFSRAGSSVIAVGDEEPASPANGKAESVLGVSEKQAKTMAYAKAISAQGSDSSASTGAKTGGASSL